MIVKHQISPCNINAYSNSEVINQSINQVYLMSKTWEVFAQSSEPEAHVKNARQTKDMRIKDMIT